MGAAPAPVDFADRKRQQWAPRQRSDPDPSEYMRFTQDTGSGNSIQSYSEQGIVINDRLFGSSVLVTAEQVEAWSPATVAELDARQLDMLVARQPGIIVLGTGASLVFPPAPLLAGIQRHGIGIEVMANDAAVRTFNVLLSEDRPVLLALLQNR